ncbi:MAG: hypothetical protein ACE5JT_03040 [Nitrosopumilaceae archaeon]
MGRKASKDNGDIKKKKKTKLKKKGKPKKESKPKKEKLRLDKPVVENDHSGIVVIEDDVEADKKSELEERRAYLEEARSQEASDD